MMNDYHIRANCRLCKATKLTRVLELPDTPLANEFVAQSDCRRHQEKFPLFVVRCDRCGHVQLPVVVNPERLFRNYLYVSGTSSAFVSHFDSFASDVIEQCALPEGSLVVEIGSNDGTALKAFKKRGMRVLGVDPATKIAEQATRTGIPTLNHFFTPALAEEILEREGYAKVVVANNVFAHADDLEDILVAVITLLDPSSGVFVFEVQYLADMMERGYFDMIYHEHLSYHSVAPLVPFLECHALYVNKCRFVTTHGGSIRITCSFQKPSPHDNAKVRELIDTEAFRLERHGFGLMASTIAQASEDLSEFFNAAKRKAWGFGAPAKLTTLFYALGLSKNDFSAIIDDNPLKQGLFTPGEHIPVISMEEFTKRAPSIEEDLVVFAWNYAAQIKQRFIETSHRLYTPLPRMNRLH